MPGDVLSVSRIISFPIDEMVLSQVEWRRWSGEADIKALMFQSDGFRGPISTTTSYHLRLAPIPP
jgi:hypothetical protein